MTTEKTNGFEQGFVNDDRRWLNQIISRLPPAQRTAMRERYRNVFRLQWRKAENNGLPPHRIENTARKAANDWLRREVLNDAV